MRVYEIGAVVAIVNGMSSTAAGRAEAAAGQAEAAADRAESAAGIAEGLTIVDGKICVKYEAT